MQLEETARIRRGFLKNEESTRNFIGSLKGEIQNAEKIEELYARVDELAKQLNELQKHLTKAQDQNKNRLCGLFGTKRKFIVVTATWTVSCLSWIAASVSSLIKYEIDGDDEDDEVRDRFYLSFILLSSLCGGASLMVSGISGYINRKDKKLNKLASTYLDKADAEEIEALRRFLLDWKRLKNAQTTRKADRRFSECVERLEKLPESVGSESLPEKEELLSAVLLTLPPSHPCYLLIQKILKEAHAKRRKSLEKISDLPTSSRKFPTFEGAESELFFSSPAEEEREEEKAKEEKSLSILWNKMENKLKMEIPYIKSGDLLVKRGGCSSEDETETG